MPTNRSLAAKKSPALRPARASSHLERKRLTVEQYLSLPEDDEKSELIDGVLIVSPSAGFWHQNLSFHLQVVLHRWIKARDLGQIWFDLDMVLDEKRGIVYRPDLVYLSKTHLHRLLRERVFGPADLCVEIISSSDKPQVLLRKHQDYARYSVRWYWEIHRREQDWQLLEYELGQAQEYVLKQELTGQDWFEPGLFPGLIFRLGPLASGEYKQAVKGQAKRLL
jgi:Uma2 family endonuclease